MSSVSDTITTEIDTPSDRSGAERSRFVRMCLLFSLPLLVVCLPPMLVLWKSGESIQDLNTVLEHYKAERTLVGFAYNEQNYPYLKYRRLVDGPPPQILALGSSRVLSFRKEMFTARFFNAGYTIQTVSDIQAFLNELPTSHHPETLLVCLDQWMFNPEWCSQTMSAVPEHWTKPPSSGLRQTAQLIPNVLKDLARGRIRPASLFNSAEAANGQHETRIGLNAVMNSRGFRNDGSFSYGDLTTQLLRGDPAVRDFEFADTLDRVAKGQPRFNFGSQLDTGALADVRSMLTYCRERNIHVVAFVPPFADRVYEAMCRSGQHQYLSLINSEVGSLFDVADAEFYEFQSLSSCGATDAEAIDGFHGGEVAYLRILIHMLQEDSELVSHANLQQLQQDLTHAASRYAVYAE